VFEQIVLTHSLYRKPASHLIIVALFAASMLVAQFSALQHSIHHPFHEHTHLCDSFLDFDHSSNSLTHSISLLLSFEKISTPYVAETQAAFNTESSTFRIRGPPSLLG